MSKGSNKSSKSDKWQALGCFVIIFIVFGTMAGFLLWRSVPRGYDQYSKMDTKSLSKYELNDQIFAVLSDRARQGDQEAFNFIIDEGLGSSDVNERAKAMNLLKELGTSAIEPLVEALGHSYAPIYEIREALKTQSAMAIPVLINHLEQTQDAVSLRVSIADTLQDYSEPEVIEALINVLNDSEWPVREKAITSLYYIDAFHATPSGIKAARQQLSQEDLSNIASDYKDLMDLVNLNPDTPDSTLSWVLIQALGNHGTKDMAEDYLNGGHPELKDAAEQWADINGYTVTVVTSTDNNEVGWLHYVETDYSGYKLVQKK